MPLLIPHPTLSLPPQPPSSEAGSDLLLIMDRFAVTNHDPAFPDIITDMLGG